MYVVVEEENLGVFVVTCGQLADSIIIVTASVPVAAELPLVPDDAASRDDVV